jgi:hypothetical protein
MAIAFVENIPIVASIMIFFTGFPFLGCEPLPVEIPVLLSHRVHDRMLTHWRSALKCLSEVYEQAHLPKRTEPQFVSLLHPHCSCWWVQVAEQSLESIPNRQKARRKYRVFVL